MALAAYRAAIRHAAAQRDVVAAADLMLRQARDVEFMKYDRTPLEALHGGSLAETLRRAALSTPSARHCGRSCYLIADDHIDAEIRNSGVPVV